MKSPVARGVVWVLAVVLCVVCMYLCRHLALLHYRSPKESEGVLSQACTAFAASSCEKVARNRWSMFPPAPAEEDKTRTSKAPATAEADKQPRAEAAGQQASEDSESKTASTEQPKPKQTHKGIPTAQVGLAFFSVVLCWLMFTGPAPVTRVWVHVVFVIGVALGLAVSVFFEVIMWTQLDAWCPLCVGAHVGALLIAVFALLLWPRGALVAEPPAAVVPGAAAGDGGGGLFGPMPGAVAGPARVGVNPVWPTARVIVTTLTTAVLLVALEHFYITGFSLKRNAETAKAREDYFNKRFMHYERYWQHNLLAWNLMPVLDIPVEGRPVRGSASAPHTVVVFSDFECPSCARFEKHYREKVAPMAGKAPNGGFKVIFKHWPICKDCNEAMTGNTLHPAACEAALATEAARILGGDEAFWKMHDLLFEHQNDWKKSRNFVVYAKQIGLDEAEFRKAMGSSQALARVRADVADGAAVGRNESTTRRGELKVEGTPTIFVDGKRLNSPQNANTWASILRMLPPGQAMNRPTMGAPTIPLGTSRPAPAVGPAGPLPANR
ncbi:MAG: thioredoxin domain-containing protein [Planctomycetes bacterium]|nr:thioredoxin domain-containing protein [Planctomycetota bacterium]